MNGLLLTLLLLFGAVGDVLSIADAKPDLDRRLLAPSFENSTAASQPPQTSCRIGIDSCAIPAVPPWSNVTTTGVQSGNISSTTSIPVAGSTNVQSSNILSTTFMPVSGSTLGIINGNTTVTKVETKVTVIQTSVTPPAVTTAASSTSIFASSLSTSVSTSLATSSISMLTSLLNSRSSNFIGSPVSSTSVISNGTTSLPNDKIQVLGTPSNSVSIQKSSVTLTSGSTTTASSTTTDAGTLTDEPHLTLTTLPIGVNFVTLDSVTYTSPTYITTTSPGSSHSTIVPIIFPFVGPPMICFNCYISFPPNIQIDVPQFCIQLLGLKIGNCPPRKDNKNDNDNENTKDDKKGEKDEEKEGGDDKQEDDEKPTKSEEQATTTSTSSSSCTVTITATHRSVFCSVTKGNSADAACSTTAYTTATECSALGKATTLTTTETPTPVVPLCGPDTCGERVCPETKEKRPKAPAAKGLLKRGEPALGQWPEPSDHPNHQAFIAGQIMGIAEGGVTQPRYSPKLVRHFDGAPISAEWIAFKSEVTALALQGLYGCTSIILVSRRGAWVSHIWQTVIMNVDPDVSFLEMIEDDLPRGINPMDPAAEYYQYGLVEMKDHPELGDAGVMFGDDAEGIHTPSSLNMRAFIVTPRAYMTPELYRDPDGRMIPHAILNNIHHQRGTVRTPREVERLQREIFDVYGDIPLEVLDYNPIVPKLEHSRKWDSDHVMVDDDGTEYSLREYMAVKSMGTVRGKFLLQYQPARSCQDQAEWRLWFEGQPVGDRADAWAPMPTQIFSQPGNSSQPGRRQEQVCEIPIQSTPPAPGSPTSAGGPASSPISPPRTIPSVPVTLPSTSALGIVYPSGSSPVLPTSHANNTTIRFPVNNTDIWIPTTVGPVPPMTRVNTTTPQVAVNRTDLGRSTTVDNLIDTITTTIKVIAKPTTLRVPSSTIAVIPTTSSTHPTTKASSTSKEVVKTTSVPSKPPPMTTTSSATKASSTSKAVTKTMSSRSRPPAPAPSEAVAIYYVDTMMRDFNGMLEIEGAWWMFPVNVEKDFLFHDPCGKEPQGWKFLDAPLSLENVPWPPSLEAEKIFFDQRFCRYKEQSGGTGYGTLTCEDMREFACERDPRAAKKIECSKDPVVDRAFVARVLCKFPTTDYREDVEEIASGEGVWVKTKVPILID